MRRCSICQEPKRELTCASCTNFSLLKLKLSYYSLLTQHNQLNSKINHILSNCIQNNNYEFIKRYNELQRRSDDEASGLEGVSMDSVVALSSQLLTIDTLIMKRKNNKIIRIIEGMNGEKRVVSLKIEELNQKIKLKKASIESKRSALVSNKKLIELKNEINTKKQDQSKILKQLDVSKSLLFQELINLYNLKKRKLSSSNTFSSSTPSKSTINELSNQKFIYMISFTPILSIWNIIEFNNEIINNSMMQCSKLINQISKILQIQLPFEINYQFNDDNNDAKNNKSSYIIPRVGNFQINLLKGMEIWEISTFELRLFINGFTRLIYDVLIIFQHLELLEDFTNYDELLKFDELIYKLGNNDHKIITTKTTYPNITGGQKMDNLINDKEGVRSLDIDKLTSRCLDQVLDKINKKNNEWHVVKKEMLIDELVM